jgi:hypothetical protein
MTAVASGTGTARPELTLVSKALDARTSWIGPFVCSRPDTPIDGAFIDSFNAH